MTKTQLEVIRVVIAEACGFKSVPDKYYIGGLAWLDYAGNKAGATSDLPDYPNDLNAMHEAEKTLHPVRVSTGGEYPPESEGWGRYVFCLLRTAEAHGVSAVHAPAWVRAEAFVRHIGRWVD